jgi:hypothetical protein
LPDGLSEIFLYNGLDISTSGTKVICPSGSLSVARTPAIPAAFSAIRARRPKFLVRRRGGDLLNPANIHLGKREIIARDLSDESHPVGWAKRSVPTMLATHTRDKAI